MTGMTMTMTIIHMTIDSISISIFSMIIVMMMMMIDDDDDDDVFS